jgi:hypothetical protein
MSNSSAPPITADAQRRFAAKAHAPSAAEVRRQREAEARIHFAPIKAGAVTLGTPDVTGGAWKKYAKKGGLGTTVATTDTRKKGR